MGEVSAKRHRLSEAGGRAFSSERGAGRPAEETTRSGFVALAGRPNVGKSTLANAIVGAKVAIVSDKPQTTRRAIRGVATGSGWQLVLVDLPGVQRPRDALTERMQRRVEHELTDADGCLFVVNAEQGIGPGDRFIAELLGKAPVPVVIAANKIDRADRARLAATLQAAADLDVADEIFPVAALSGAGVGPLVEHLVSLLPEGPFYFGPQQHSDQPEAVLLAELVREQVLARTREEVPHAVEVEIEAIEEPRPDLVRIEAVILVETDSQKGILIGAGGKMVKSIGIAARRVIERELGTRVHLELSVRVRRHWRADERLLDRLGIE
jgi:GTPase